MAAEAGFPVPISCPHGRSSAPPSAPALVGAFQQLAAESAKLRPAQVRAAEADLGGVKFPGFRAASAVVECLLTASCLPGQSARGANPSTSARTSATYYV